MCKVCLLKYIADYVSFVILSYVVLKKNKRCRPVLALTYPCLHKQLACVKSLRNVNNLRRKTVDSVSVSDINTCKPD